MLRSFKNAYAPCACNSGKKVKFCCGPLASNRDSDEFSRYISNIPVSVALQNVSDGLASIVIMREMPNHFWMAGIYVVDTWCLGVKDAFLMDARTREEIESSYTKRAPWLVMEPITYEAARSLVFGAVRYARSLGFEYHKDFRIAQNFIEPHRPFANTCTFGRNGRPVFIEGPYDRTERDYHYIVSQVLKVGGEVVSQK